MSTIESNLDSIAQSLKIIADLLTVQTATKAVQNAPVPQAPTVAPVQVAAHVVPAPQPVVAAAPAPVPAPVMPPAPVFTPAAPTLTVPVTVTPTAPVVVAVPTPVTASPFSDKQAMMDFVMSSYKALGVEKGAKIQDVLNGLGYRNINDVPADKWADLKVGIEALK